MNYSDYIIAYKILKDLGTPWIKFKAYELGLINNKGEKIKNSETPEEKESVNSYMKMIFNLKRLLQKVVGKNNLAQQIVSLFLLKESKNKELKLNENVTNYIVNYYKIEEFSKGAKINENHKKMFIDSFLESVIIDYN